MAFNANNFQCNKSFWCVIVFCFILEVGLGETWTSHCFQVSPQKMLSVKDCVSKFRKSESRVWYGIAHSDY